MFWRTTLAASLLAWRVHAGIGAMVAEGYLARRSSADLERMMQLAVDTSAVAQEYPEVLSKRQGAGGGAAAKTPPMQTPAGVVLNPDGTINMTAWEQLANQACNEALVKLPLSSNPSGTCICYNLPALNRQTGAFEADLRLYQLSTPSGEFAGIPPDSIQVGLTYSGASVSPVTPQTAKKLVATRQAPEPVSQNTGLTLLQTYLFVGQIDQKNMKEAMTAAELEALVMPILTLSAVNSSGQTISTNVSSNEAAFVAGEFSNEIFMSEFAVASAAVDQVMLSMKNPDFTKPDTVVAFVLPGVQIMIFPIGLVVTGLWTVVFVAVVGYGTYQRASYRSQFRRRIASGGRL